MKLKNLLEDDGEKKMVVIYGGRFQPFHRGHYKAFKWLKKRFGEDNVWIATSNKTNFDHEKGKVSPFNFKEKKEIITTLYDVDPRKIVRCENPTFKPSEIFQLYRGYQVVYVAAVGAKNVNRYDGDFYHPLPNHSEPDDAKRLLTRDEAGYFVKVPEQGEGITGTDVRDSLTSAESSDLEGLFKQHFGSYDEGIAKLIVARLKEVK